MNPDKWRRTNVTMLKIFSHDILMQEVPGEVSLALSVSNCPYRCKFCHTPELQEDVGDPFASIARQLIDQYKDGITCVLFLGGDGQWDSLTHAAGWIKDTYDLKTAVYLGATEAPEKLLKVFDYIKVGPYVHELGGLAANTTNQRMYKISNEEIEDITYLFWRDKK